MQNVIKVGEVAAPSDAAVPRPLQICFLAFMFKASNVYMVAYLPLDREGVLILLPSGFFTLHPSGGEGAIRPL